MTYAMLLARPSGATKLDPAEAAKTLDKNNGLLARTLELLGQEEATMAMIQAVLPKFRQRKAGVIVNVTSSVTLTPLPLLSVYTASKAAVDACTASLALELEQFNVRVSLVMPGRAPDTSFGSNARSRMQAVGGFDAPYAALLQQVMAG